MRLLITLGLLTMLAAAGCSQTTIKAWEFDAAGNAGGWMATHSVAPFEVSDGTLKTKITGSDPYMNTPVSEFEANGFQYIEIRLRSEVGGSAEFFWGTVEKGIVAGQERGFQIQKDGQWHTYHLYPQWTGIINALRFDTPDGENSTFEIDYIHIAQGPISTHDLASATWDFTKDNQGWVAMSGGTHLTPTAKGAATELTAENVTLISSAAALKTEDYNWAYFKLSLSAPATLNLSWSGAPEGAIPGGNVIQEQMSAGTAGVNIRLNDTPTWTGALTKFSLTINADPGTAVVLEQVTLSKEPLGPGAMVLDAVQVSDYLLASGAQGILTAKVTNRGGEALQKQALKLLITEGAGRIADGDTRTIATLAPGQSAEVQWPVTPQSTGRIAFKVSAGETTGNTDALVATQSGEMKPSATPTALVRDGDALLANDKIALSLVKVGDNYMAGRLCVFQQTVAKQMAVLPSLAQMQVAGMDAPVMLTLDQAEASQLNGIAMLTLKGTTKFGTANVSVQIKYTLQANVGYVDTEYALTTDSNLAVTSFRGPWLWAGEGTFRDQQDMALFPGVEYLEAGEKSSSTLDIAPPANVRFAPNPNFVTVPSMAVEKDKTIVGLMWDPLQDWAEGIKRPTAVFASPNFVEKRSNHLMGLSLPSVPEYAKPNELVAKTAYVLESGKSLSLKASLYAEDKSDVLRSMDFYLQRFGLPALPNKARSYAETVQMSMESYEKILWDEKTRGWSGVIGWAPGRDQSVAFHYYLGSKVVKDPAFATSLKDKALDIASPADLRFALSGIGEPCRVLSDQLGTGRAQTLNVPADGRYNFNPVTDMQKALGVPGETASGLCVDAVLPIIRKALYTGDLKTLEGAERTLKFMERFKVPRASQVWEVPVHVPDILASGHLAEVYLNAYKLTGKKEYLTSAVYWAKTGIPFIYMWRDPQQRELMLGASIPVFGATMYTGSWFAVPVQWCGLAYGVTLYDLAQYDSSLPWRHFAEMMTISGMNQQSTREKDYGTYTDNWNVITDVECVGCMLSPVGLLQNVYELMDMPCDVQTQVVRIGGTPVAINSMARISDAKVDAGVLHFELRGQKGQSGNTTLMPLADPVQIEVDNVELKKFANLEDVAEGWSWREGLGCLTLKLKYSETPRLVRIIKPVTIVAQLQEPAWEFNRDGDNEGWVADHAVTPLEVNGGCLRFSATGGDPYIVSPGFSVPAAEYPICNLRIKVSQPGCTVYFATNNAAINAQQQLAVHVPADGEFHDISIDMRKCPEWKGAIMQLRLDVMDAPNDVVIDSIRLERHSRL